ncbi:hypothetical protein PR048_012109 [Dryococelus australis]|uniref:Transposase n=1 Tax=Dryococelus australis TaxID=614101 RepID=A0ABQ9HNI3_9NEOP|nr:hypothetical protein PR048_012109 [Dryococelus australis]
MSATGHYIPSLIFARKRQNPALMHGAPPGTVSFVSDCGYMTVLAITFANENNINLLSRPPHISRKTQPLDRCFFKPLKARYDELCDKW